MQDIYLLLLLLLLLLLRSFMLQVFANYYLQAYWRVVVSQPLPQGLNNLQPAIALDFKTALGRFLCPSITQLISLYSSLKQKK